ncbi:hypothetical protein [Verrucomicrobium spinosum]|uniref:hypothetical protein n=1 Tax=Verrucomicrobium spinosum TaxID=2736 RepID=UPI000A71D360|nr:hypothetical protein [Verrucomicrobium spinosum]
MTEGLEETSLAEEAEDATASDEDVAVGGASRMKEAEEETAPDEPEATERSA